MCLSGAPESIFVERNRSICRNLKNVLERKLHDPWTHAGGDLAERPAVQSRIRAAEPHAVSDIEGLGSKLDLMAFGDTESSGNALTPIPVSRTSQAACSHVPLSAGCGQCKRSGIEPTHARTRHTALPTVGCRYIRKHLIGTLRYGSGSLAIANPVVSLIAADHRH
jgi:hypothetical protein